MHWHLTADTDNLWLKISSGQEFYCARCFARLDGALHYTSSLWIVSALQHVDCDFWSNAQVAFCDNMLDIIDCGASFDISAACDLNLQTVVSQRDCRHYSHENQRYTAIRANVKFH